MTFSTYDPYDAEWEHPDTGRTAAFSRDDDDNYCEGCDSTVTYSGPDDKHGTCKCEEARS